MNVIDAGFVEFGPEVAGDDQKAKLLLNCEDLVGIHFVVILVLWLLNNMTMAHQFSTDNTNYFFLEGVGGGYVLGRGC